MTSSAPTELGTVLASIPSPSTGVIDIGPLSIHAYGLMIALGVVAAVWLTGRRFEERGVATRDDMSAVAVRAVIAGVIGARLYHVVTDWSSFDGDYLRMLQIWKGGLGIPGALLLGVPVGMWYAKQRGVPPAVAATCAAPSLALAQAIGRWGNWFNQELFGRATDLPWALEVSDDTAIGAGYSVGTTFHPTFLYESLWNLALCAVLLWIDRRFRPRAGHLFGMYVIGYGVGRFWIEGLRIDPAHEIAGLRVNQWMSIVAIVLAFGYLYVSSQRAPREHILPDGRVLDRAGFAPRDQDRRGDLREGTRDEAQDHVRDVIRHDTGDDTGDAAGDERFDPDADDDAHDDADEVVDDGADSGSVTGRRYLPEDG